MEVLIGGYRMRDLDCRGHTTSLPHKKGEYSYNIALSFSMDIVRQSLI